MVSLSVSFLPSRDLIAIQLVSGPLVYRLIVLDHP